MRKKLIILTMFVLVGCMAGCGTKNADEAAMDADENAAKVTEIQGAEVPGVNSGEEEEPEEEDDSPIIYSDADLLWVLPKGFKALENEEGVYVTKGYRKDDDSTVTYVIAESEEDISKVTKEEFQEMMEADFLDAYGDQVPINIINYENMKVDGRSGLRIDMEYKFKGEEYAQTAIMLYNGKESHIIYYTQEKDGKWKDEFENSIASLSFAK